MTKRRIGIIGGTFDPVHIGHLFIAETVQREYNLEKVIFVPASNPPHKQATFVTSVLHRYIMAVKATADNDSFAVSTIEISRNGLSYSIDTVKEIMDLYGEETDIFFVTGADTIAELPTWNRIDQLLRICHFVGTARPGCLSGFDKIREHFGDIGQKRIHRLSTPELEISSTDIRERVKTGRSIRYIVPERVEKYIRQNGLYL